jgi:nicotinamide riboside kinase
MEENLKQLQNTGKDIIKIAIYGPESTGKTTLAKQLALHYNTVWAPEYAREYLQKKWNSKKEICAEEDLLPIAIGQMQIENEALENANQFLFADTCLMITKVFSEIYYGFCNPNIDKAARKHRYDLFFLTDIDVPWEMDDLRDKPKGREVTFDTFRKALIDCNKPFIVLKGNQKQRFSQAIIILKALEKSKKLGLSSHQFVQIYESGIAIEAIEFQLDRYQNGIQKTIIDRPAIINDGILQFSPEEHRDFSKQFDDKKQKLKLKKFVPASGAASRMFKFLIEFLNEFDAENETINAYINRKNAADLMIFLSGMEKFPFYHQIDEFLKNKFSDFNSWSRDKKNHQFIYTLLNEKSFEYASKPKGVLPFHTYKNRLATPIEEHLFESIYYAASNNESFLHFTISQNHQEHFESAIKLVKQKIEKDTKTKININFSYQNTATNSIAVNSENEPIQNEFGELVFRPGGHGALIQNLNQLDADIVFIKNIDNIIQNNIDTIALYKKSLAGILCHYQQIIFNYLKIMESNTPEIIDEITSFVENDLKISIIEDFTKYTLENKIEYLKNVLNRPIRVCGMVKNEGEVGGGPFWVKDAKGFVSLQIVETAQIDLANVNQNEIHKKATHFNPVDLVCGIKNYKGIKFNLEQFIDANSGFVVEKTKKGKYLKAYELPGLWNGAMANWITIFVEIPLITFNPVKTVNDLLKPAHQND